MRMTSEADTKAFGLQIAEKLEKGSILALTGDLGTGKTTLTRYIAAGLGVSEEITSPTFTIVHEYRSGRLPLYHFDVYRIGDEEEMYELGYEEYFYGDGVTIVEWADIIEGLIPADALRIHMTCGSTEEERIYECTF